MSKRVHEIAKERGLQPKELLAQLQAAGLKVKAVSSSVDEAEARRVLENGGGDGTAAGNAAPSAPADGGRESRGAQRGDGGAQRGDGGAQRGDGGAQRSER